MTNSKPKTIDEYIADAPEQGREKLREIRALLKEVAPNATEAIKWSYPVLEQERILFSFSAFKDHLNFMPTRSTLDQFKDELRDHKTGRDTIQFPYNKPLPKSLIQKLAKHRVREVREGALWMHKD
jgi:uncharacterized protein YdhG (YjbR/CyaY superfamily)